MMSKTDRILNNIYYIMETMTVGDVGWTQAAPASGPLAGFDPLMGFKRTKKNKIDFRRVKPSYKVWINSEINK